MDRSMNCRLLWSSAVCAALVGCASSADAPVATVVRTRAPQAYEKTITNYFAFKVRGPQKNMKFSFGDPEPGDCALDGYLNSIRGWVVPVLHETYSGEPNGRDTIRITAKQYYFWFFGDTIAGITPRRDLCPGVGSAFDPVPPAAARTVISNTSLTAPLAPEAPAAERAAPTKAPAAARAPSRAKSSQKKRGTAQRPKKRSASPAPDATR
jgi:hypothetical protein